MSRTAAPVGEVMMADAPGQTRQWALALGSEQAFPLEFGAQFLELPPQGSEPGVLHMVDDELVFAPRLVQPMRARTNTFWPSLAVKAHNIFRCRNMAQRTCASASLSEKYQCPELGLAKLEISASSQRLPNPRSKRRRIDLAPACGKTAIIAQEMAQSATLPKRPDRTIYSVSRLNREVSVLLERGFGSLWLEAEISNFARPNSGHWYFSLNDADAQVRCAMFRQRNMLCAFTASGTAKRCWCGPASGCTSRGANTNSFVDHMEDAGLGALRAAVRELSAKLSGKACSLPSASAHCRVLPRRIGIITSPTGAARPKTSCTCWPGAFLRRRCLIYPVPVQGAQAAADIIAALETAGRRAECDVLILARGGGSLEDLLGVQRRTLGARHCGFTASGDHRHWP